MTYYRVDTLALGSAKSSNVAAVCGSLMDALAGLRAVRISVRETTGEWVRQVGVASERALSLVDQHVDSMLHNFPDLTANGVRATRADRELRLEHDAIRRNLLAQVTAVRTGAANTPAGAIRLLDMTVDTECLLALHINGLVAVVAGQETTVVATPQPLQTASTSLGAHA